AQPATDVCQHMWPGLPRRGHQLFIDREWRSVRVLFPSKEHPFGVRVRFVHGVLWLSEPPGRMGTGKAGTGLCRASNGTRPAYPYSTSSPTVAWSLYDSLSLTREQAEG